MALATLAYNENAFSSDLQYAKSFDPQAQLEVHSGDTKRSGILFAFFTIQF